MTASSDRLREESKAEAVDPGPRRLLDRLRARYGRRAAIAAAGVLALIVFQNAFWMVRNQRELPHDRFLEFDDWFQVSPRDIEKVANRARLYTVYGRAGIWHFLDKRIAGAHLKIPKWLADERWELENVAHLEIEVSDVPMTVSKKDARRLRRVAEKRGDKRKFHRRGRGARKVKMQAFLIVHDPAATRYVLAESEKGDELFVLPEAQYAALHSARVEAP